MDLFLWAVNHEISENEVAEVMGYTDEQVQRVYDDIRHKRNATRYLHTEPLLVEQVFRSISKETVT